MCSYATGQNCVIEKRNIPTAAQAADLTVTSAGTATRLWPTYHLCQAEYESTHLDPLGISVGGTRKLCLPYLLRTISSEAGGCCSGSVRRLLLNRFKSSRQNPPNPSPPSLPTYEALTHTRSAPIQPPAPPTGVVAAAGRRVVKISTHLPRAVLPPIAPPLSQHRALEPSQAPTINANMTRKRSRPQGLARARNINGRLTKNAAKKAMEEKDTNHDDRGNYAGGPWVLHQPPWRELDNGA